MTLWVTGNLLQFSRTASARLTGPAPFDLVLADQAASIICNQPLDKVFLTLAASTTSRGETGLPGRFIPFKGYKQVRSVVLS
jgi:hypothetical protein